MRSLPLFKAEVLAPVEAVTPRECSATCELCAGIRPIGAVSHTAIGDPGGILLVGDMPTQLEAKAGMLPFSAQAGKWIIAAIGRATSLPVAADYAVKCALGKAKVADATIAQCRPHLANTVFEVQPQLIMVFGTHACMSVLGRKFNASMTTGGIGFTSEGVPVVVYPTVAEITSNKFMRQAFEASIPWALGDHEAPPWHKPYRMVESELDAAQACAELAAAEWFAFDTETDGLMFTDYFRVNTLAACAKGSRTAWVWDEKALLDPVISGPLRRLMLDPAARKVAHNLKFDNHAVNCFFDIVMVGQHICTLLWARLIDAECDGRLEVLAEKVGMGGHKAEAKQALVSACKTIREVQDGTRAPENPREEQALQYSTVSEKAWAYGVLNKEIRDRYCARDCVTTVMLCELQERTIAPEQKTHWDVLVSKTTAAIQQVEAWGLPVDESHLRKYETWLSGEMVKAEAEIFKLAGYTLNPGNNGEVHKLLFEELGMKSVKDTPGGKASVDKDALAMLSRQAKGKAGAMIEQLLLWRKMQKQLSTYATGMRPHVRGDGRVHTSLNIAGAASGRLSSSQPNCFSGDTEVLTPDGWVAFHDLKEGVPVIQWDGGALTFVQPTAYVKTTGTLIDIVGPQTHLRVTPDHRCALRQRYAGAMKVFVAADYPVGQQEWHQLHGGNYDGGTVTYSNAQLAVLAACTIDGVWIDGGLQIKTKKPWNIRTLVSALETLGYDQYTITPENASLVGGTVVLPAKTCSKLLAWITSLLEEALVLGPWVFLLDAETRQQFLYELTRWSSITSKYTARNKISTDYVQAMCALSNRKTRSRLVSEALQPDRWEVTLYSHAHSVVNTHTKTAVSSTHDVYCLSVPSSYVLIRYNGCVTVTAQCQNIPKARGNEEGRMARNVFCATPGHTLLELDFKQLEICIAAGLSGDKKMQAILAEGVDFHLRTAQMVSQTAWGIKPDQVTKVHRDAGKCFHPDTEVLTRTGWKRITALQSGEEIVQADPGPDCSVKLSWTEPLEVFTRKHPMNRLVHLKNEGIDLRVTPDHRMLGWHEFGAPYVTIPESLGQAYYWANAGVLPGLSLDIDAGLLRLAVATQADGSLTENGAIRFGFSKQRKIDRLAMLLEGMAYTRHGPNKKGVTSFSVPRAAAQPILALLEGKSLPWWWLSLSVEHRQVVLSELPLWDGHVRANWRAFRYHGCDEQSIDVAQAIATATGLKTRKKMTFRGNEKRRPVWALTVRDKGRTRGGNLKTESEPYTDEVACLSVPSTFVLVRDQGIPVICGQTINFATLYGQGIPRLAHTMNVTHAAAERVQSAIFEEFKDLVKWIRECVAWARLHGDTWTSWLGRRARRRPLIAIGGVDQKAAGSAERSSYNTKVQGGASDFCLASVVDCVDWLLGDCVPAELVLTVHDSLLFNVRDDVLQEVALRAEEIMTSRKCEGVQLTVDKSVGRTWGQLVEYKFDEQVILESAGHSKYHLQG